MMSSPLLSGLGPLWLLLGAAAVTALATWPLVLWLRGRQFGKVIRADGPDHAAKAGTPTMGGLMMLIVSGFALLPMAWANTEVVAWQALAAALLCFGALGLLDDWKGLARKGQARELGVGLTARQMLLAQALVAVAIAWVLRDSAASWASLEPAAPPWAPWAVWTPAAVVARYGIFAWLLLAVLAVVSTVNGVNLSDGLDGLAAGLIALAFAGLATALWLNFGHHVDAAAAAGWAFVVAGTCTGFLVHNRHPARVFMGNVSSMALGGALAVFALATGLWPLLPIVGAVFVIEVLSDIVQIGYFKLSGGQRILRMAPIHHHFELGGWPETRVVRRFWLAGLAAAVAGVGLALLGSGS